MTERLEGTFFGYQDAELFYQVWRPAEIRGTIVLTHGIGEHSECYDHLAQALANEAWQTVAWDLRGHGKSEGKRGYVRHFSDYSDDLVHFIDFVKASLIDKSKPLCLLGHSLGGLITTKTLTQYSPQGIAAVALSSPALGLSVSIPVFKEKSAHFLAQWAPKLTLHNEIPYEHLHKDSELLKLYKSDPLRHEKISPKLYLGMLEAMEEVKIRAPEIHIPFLMQLSGQDQVVSTPEAKNFFQQVGSKKKELLVYEDSFHEIFNDVEQEQVIQDLKNFLKSNT